MQALRDHIMLIGFKHAGKSVVGESLAKKLHAPFIDLDQVIESLYEKQCHQKYTCRQIMQEKGEDYFRLLEKSALSQVIGLKPSIISLGGGTPLNDENKKIIKSCMLVHITSPRDVVFERIQMSGIPAFFNPHENLEESFNRLWDKRIKIYEEIKNFSIENNGSVDDAVKKITNKLSLEAAV